MKKITEQGNISLLRFDPGEEMIQKLSKYCNENNILGGTFTAIGAASKVLLSYYNLEAKQYEDHEIQEDIEILSVIGNVACMGEEYVIHAHGTFGLRDFSTKGGHIKQLVVSATCEISFTSLPPMERAYDEVTGLNLLQ